MVLTATTLFGWVFLPSFMHIPDGYAIDVQRDPPHFARPVDYDNMVSFDLFHGPILRGGTMSLRFDEEDRSFGSGGGDAVRVRFEWKF